METNPIATAYRRIQSQTLGAAPALTANNPSPETGRAEEYRQVVDDIWGKEEKTPDDLRIEAVTARHAVNMAESQAKVEKALTDADRAKTDRAGLKPRIDSLSPEEHGKLLGNLVADFIKAGVDPARAYTLALRTLNPETAVDQGDKPPSGNQLTDKIVSSILQKALDNLESGPKPAVPNPPAAGSPNMVQTAIEMFQQFRGLGEAYMQSVGIDPKEIAEMRRKPEGGSFLTNLGANIGGNFDLQIQMMKLQDEQKRHWFEFEQKTRSFESEEKRVQEEHDERLKSHRAVRSAIEQNLGPAIEAGKDFIEGRRQKDGGSPSGSDTRVAVCTECKHPNIVSAEATEFTCEKCGAELEILGKG